MIILGTNSIKDTGYNVANSCRFNSADSSYLDRTPGSVTSTRKNTFSFWVKRGLLGAYQYIISTRNGTSTNRDGIAFNDSDQIDIRYNAGSSSPIRLTTTRVFRDPTAFMHIVVAVDTTQASESNRIKVYINNTQETSFATANYMAQDYDFALNAKTDQTTDIGNDARSDGAYFDGYLAEFVAIDGTQNAVTDFGEFDEDSPTIWKPKDVSGLTFGNAGFYLDFENSSELGTDVSGNSNTFSENNLDATDQATDTPTNSFCTMNPLYAATSSAFTFAQGNCELTQNDTNWRTSAGTIGVSSGKWYFEAKGGQGTNGYTHYGWSSTSWLTEKGDGSMNEPSTNHNGPCVTYYGYNGNNYYSTSSATGSNASYGNTFNNNNTIGCFLDLDNNKAYWSKDGTLQNSGTGYSIESGFTWLPIVGGFDMDNGGESVKLNFGGCPATTISSGNTDGEYGNFEYTTTITGDGSSKTFKALCTKNLAEYG